MQLYVYIICLFDEDGEVLAISNKTLLTETEAREACKKYFPQFKIEGEENCCGRCDGVNDVCDSDKPKLPDTWCVRCTGLSDFEPVKRWLADYDPTSTAYGYYCNCYYGVENKRAASCDVCFGTVLSIADFKAMTT